MKIVLWKRLLAACAALWGVLPMRAKADGETVIFAHKQATSFDSMIEELGKADVVFVGEEHDHRLGHETELAILKGLYARNPALTLSLEMFERDVQGVVDEYLSGFITETHFLQSSRPWPNYKTDYRPMVEFCKENRLPVVAANAPRRYVNIVSRKGQQGLQALPKVSKSFLAKLPYPMELPPAYDKQLTELFEGSHGPSASGATSASPPPGMPSTANMKEAQGLWDATMADSIARALRTYHGRKVMQVNGAMHSDSGYGIADRLHRANSRLKVKIVTIRPDDGFPNLPATLEENIADFVIITKPDAKQLPEKPSK